jgi:hypothetical protein
MSVSFFSPVSVINAVNADPSCVKFSFNKKQNGDILRFSVHITAEDTSGKVVTNKPLYISLSPETGPLKLNAKVMNPLDPNDLMVKKKWGMTWECKLSETGKYGEMLSVLSPLYDKWVAEQKEAGEFLPKKDVFPLIITHYSDNALEKENRGKPRKEPVIRLRPSFGKTFAALHPIKSFRGLPMTVIHDYEKPYTDDKGFLKYQHATVINDDGEEELVNYENAHKYLTRGSEIMRGRIDLSGGTQSNPGISWPQMVWQAVVKPLEDESCTDEIRVDTVVTNEEEGNQEEEEEQQFDASMF